MNFPLGFYPSNFAEQIRRKPFVYGWYREDTYLYIGRSERGAERLSNHHIIGRMELVELTDQLHLWIQTLDSIYGAESHLIMVHIPKHNTVIPGYLTKPTGTPPVDHILIADIPRCWHCATPIKRINGQGNRPFCLGTGCRKLYKDKQKANALLCAC